MWLPQLVTTCNNSCRSCFCFLTFLFHHHVVVISSPWASWPSTLPERTVGVEFRTTTPQNAIIEASPLRTPQNSIESHPMVFWLVGGLDSRTIFSPNLEIFVRFDQGLYINIPSTPPLSTNQPLVESTKASQIWINHPT